MRQITFAIAAVMGVMCFSMPGHAQNEKWSPWGCVDNSNNCGIQYHWARNPGLTPENGNLVMEFRTAVGGYANYSFKVSYLANVGGQAQSRQTTFRVYMGGNNSPTRATGSAQGNAVTTVEAQQ
jgi:hypothetical protein